MRKFINFRMSGRGALPPASPYFFVLRHHVPEHSNRSRRAGVVRRAWCGRGVGATWCTKSRQPLFFRFLCTKSCAFLRPWPTPTWCTKSRRPLYLRSLCTKSPAFFRSWPAPIWCTKSRRPLYLRFLCTKSPAFLRPCPGRRGASPPASPCFFVLRHHVPEHSSRSRRAGVVPHRSLALVSSSWGTTAPSTAAVPDRRAWCLTARSCFFVLSHHVLEHRRKVMHERLPPAFVHHFSSIIFSKGKN